MKNIIVDITPNPNARRFVVEKILKEGSEYLEISSDTQLNDSLPVLILKLAKLSYISRLFVMNNFITVIKKADSEWSNIIPEVTRIIDENLPFFELTKDVTTSNEREVIKRIKDILDTYVAPAIAMDGGAIRYHSFDEYSGTLTVEVLGSCQGCPSLFNTLKVGIQPMVSDLVPQVQSVVQLKK